MLVPRRARGNPTGCLAAPGGLPAAPAPLVRGADHAGFALRLDLGLGYTSAIPSTLDLFLARNQDTGAFPPEPPRWSTSGGALALSATYN